MRKAALPLTVLVLVMILPWASAQTPVVAEVLPAPVGYVLAFSPPHPNFIYGFRNMVGTYTPYRAKTGETGIYLVNVDDPREISTIVHDGGASPVRFIETQPLLKAYGLNFNTGNDLIIFGQGLIYLSKYNIVYWKPTSPTHLTVVVDEHSVDLNLTGVIKVLSVAYDDYISVYTPTGTMLMLRLSDLIGAPEACVAWFRDPPPKFPWVGGIILSPACVKNIEVLKTAEYAGRLFAVVFRIPAVPRLGGRIDYVVMGRPSARVLSEAGLVVKARVVHSNMHIITGYELSGTNLYVVRSENDKLTRGEVLDVRDVTQVIPQDKGFPRRVCSIPARATVLYKLLWNNREVSGTVELLPGEVILFAYEKDYYACTGDMTWVERDDLVLVRGPVYYELLHPISIYTISGHPALVVASNGKIMYGSNIEIPFEMYADNVISWYSGRYRGVVKLVLTSIFTSAFFAMLLIIVMVIVGLVIFGRGKEAPEKITIVWDVNPPPPLSLADRDMVSQTVKKHVEAFGVCPDIVDVAMYHDLLPPIPTNVKAEEEVILCPFNTNVKTESILRNIYSVLQTALWGIRRLWKTRGYIYTVFGDEMLYMYFYKQEDEERPEHILVNALESVVRSASFETTLFRRPLGLFIVVEPEMLPHVKRELSLLEELSLVPAEEITETSKPKAYNIRSYLGSRNVSTTISVERIQEVVDREVPKILVISSTNIEELLEYLSEKASAKGEDYYLKRGLGEEA